MSYSTWVTNVGLLQRHDQICFIPRIQNERNVLDPLVLALIELNPESNESHRL